MCFSLIKLGPNVSVGEKACIGPGVRVKESIVLENAVIGQHSLVNKYILLYLYSIQNKNRLHYERGRQRTPPHRDNDSDLLVYRRSEQLT